MRMSREDIEVSYIVCATGKVIIYCDRTPQNHPKVTRYDLFSFGLVIKKGILTFKMHWSPWQLNIPQRRKSSHNKCYREKGVLSLYSLRALRLRTSLACWQTEDKKFTIIFNKLWQYYHISLKLDVLIKHIMFPILWLFDGFVAQITILSEMFKW